MQILPLGLLTEEDKPIFGDLAVNLGKLKRAGLPVALGIALAPLENTQLSISKKKAPEELVKEIKKGNTLLWQEENFQDVDKLWEGIVKKWQKESLLSKKKEAEIIFLLKGKYQIIQESSYPFFQEQITAFITASQKILCFPFNYQFIVQGKKIFLIKLRPLAFPIKEEQKQLNLVSLNKQKLQKSAVKVFLKLDQAKNIVEEEKIEGIVKEGSSNFDEEVLLLGKMAKEFPGPIIYLLPQKNLLENFIKIFLFCRHQSSLLNLELGLPICQTTDDLKGLKKELAGKGIFRKGSLKFWLKLGTVENIFSIKKYLEAGLDGLILDIDLLETFFYGLSKEERNYHPLDFQALCSFLKPFFKETHQNKIPVLIQGKLSQEPEVLEFLVENGVWGIVVNNSAEGESLPDHLTWVEERFVRKIISN